ncbi:MAG TPA: type II toxin-antitoxin system CcdA family antitoxin [Actinophytocola sp.]|uniref:type II toxin-antitoxin system CcdA family antitoxin n=1 Tax=Actinophytocola sp. TaxID=1872138 RepID=UPI002DB6510E|nr:type II toxin-antitoxin system CcdA family antitoxin [Actinophytocola sp.]HEU5473001.1 type II toxin-antitoxin system CcdA family antitoxin [Actinophytocola sp.]
MARVNITVPDEILRQAKEAGLNISKLTRDAILTELDRLAKIAAFEAYMAELEAELGPPTDEQIAEAEVWAQRVFGSDKEDRKLA